MIKKYNKNEVKNHPILPSLHTIKTRLMSLGIILNNIATILMPQVGISKRRISLYIAINRFQKCISINFKLLNSINELLMSILKALLTQNDGVISYSIELVLSLEHLIVRPLLRS